jgi:DNA replication protein DnaC
MTARSWTPPKPYPYEAPREPRCRTLGCDDEATNYAPLRVGDSGARFCDAHAKEQQERVVQRQLAQLRDDMSHMYHWSLDSYPADDPIGLKAKNEALLWHKELSSSCPLYIHGPVGCGKTGLAWSILVEQIKEGTGFDRHEFVNVRQLLSRIRRSFHSDEPYEPIGEFIEDVWLLVLDDLGAERVTDWTREWLATLIEGRYVQERPTIVTSNYSPAQLARRLGHDDPIIGKRIVSRLTENAELIKIDRPDLRLRRDAA